MAGFGLGQSLGYGLTEQSTVLPGVGVASPAPGDGENYVFVCQPWDRWRLVGCTFLVATDETDVSRYVTVEYSGVPGYSIQTDAAAVLLGASSSQRYVGSLNRGVAEWNEGTDVFFPLSGLWLEVGSTVTINVGDIQAGDGILNIALTFDRWLGKDMIPEQSDFASP